MKQRNARKKRKKHNKIQEKTRDLLERYEPRELLDHAVNVKVTSRLNGTIEGFEVKFNISGGQGFIHTGRKVIESYWNETRTDPIVDEEGLEEKIGQLHETLEDIHKAQRCE